MVTQEQKDAGQKAFDSVVKVAAYGENNCPIAPLTKWWPIASIAPEGGNWYFCCNCPNCGTSIPLVRDYSEGNLGKPFRGYGLTATCASCEKDVACPSEEIHPTKWPLAPGESAPTVTYAMLPKRKHTNDPEYKPTGLIHHYTSIDALTSIISSGSLRATNINYLNDSSESELGLELMKKVGLEALNDSSGIDAEFVSFFLEWVERRTFSDASVYVLCFSESRNQLSQWRGYTAHGKGICISLDGSSFIQKMQKYNWTWQHCRYGIESQLAFAEAILIRMRREVILATGKAEVDKRMLFQNVLNTCLPDLLQVAAIIKNDGFVEEKEVRLISRPIEINNASVKFRPGKTTLIPFVDFELANTTEVLEFREIMIGPSPTQLLTEASVRGLIAQSRVNKTCLVSRSSIPYREL